MSNIKDDYIIYASYGSNILKERFYAYIMGGYFMGNYYSGCTDKTEPQDFGFMLVPYRIYFAKSSKRWNGGGVAFLSLKKEEDENYHALVRLWKINYSQFEDVKRQEGAWYSEIVNLGKKEGYDIITFTGRKEFEYEKNKPDISYLEVIKKGLLEINYFKSEEEIDKYLKKFI